MKQLTMTKVLTPLAALAFAFGVQAATVGLQSSDGFESYTAGASVTNATGWSFTAGNDGADDASAVTAYGEAAKPASLPDAFSSAGDNYLKLSTEDGMLFRNMDGAAGESVGINAGLYVDTDVQFTITDPSDRPEVTNDDKFIVWLEANGSDTNLCVWARQYTAGDASTFSNAVYSLVSADSGNAPAITPGEWHRLTVKALSSVGSGVTFPAFQVYLDGALLKAGSSQYITTTDVDDFDTATGSSGIVTGQAYFPAMAPTLTALSKVGFSGEGAIDNVAVTYAVPEFSANSAQVEFTFGEGLTGIGMASLGQTITNSGDSVSVETNTSFVITLEGYNEDAYTYTFTPSGNITYDSATRTVTVLGSGAAALAITTTAKDTVNVTFDWQALNTALGESVADNTGISFTVGDTTYTGDIDNETTCVVQNLKVGTNITITVEFASGTHWTATYTTSSANLSISDNVVTVNTRGNGTATVAISAEAAPYSVTVNGTGYYDLAQALTAATAGQTITLQADVESAATLSTAAATIDLNGYSLGSATTITFTGSGAATLKGGEITNCYDTLTINSPAGQNLTIEGVTFHCSVKPQTASDASLLLVTNCQFLCDIAKDGTTDAGKDYHSYGVTLVANSRFAIADIVGNEFEHPRRSAVQVGGFTNDAYICSNSFDATRLTTYYNGGSSGDGNELFPEMQIYGEGRIFIENNTFTGQYMTGTFGLYNKTSNKSTDASLVFNGNTVDASVPYLWTYYVDIASGGATNVTGDLVMPNVFFGANNIGAGVDTTQGRYKELVQPVPVAYAENLALPTGVATVYEWTHGANAATPYYVTLSGTPSYAANLTEVEAGDTVVAVPGAAEPVDTAELTFTVDPTYKNQWTAAAPAPSGEAIAPGAQSTTTYDSQAAAEAALANVTIAPAAAVTNDLSAADATAYAGKFEAKVVQVSEGQYKVEVALTAAATTALQTEVNADAAEVIEDLSESTVTLTTTPGFYYSIKYGTTLDNMTEGARTLATGSTLNLTRPTTSGATAGFYKVLVNIAPAE